MFYINSTHLIAPVTSLNHGNTRTHSLRRAIMSAITAMALTACGGGDQDSGQVATQTHNFSGVAVDGYISRAKIFVDTNNNATRDPWEPFAFTDDDGYYGYNPNTSTNYCALDATAEQQQYCLKTQSSYGNIVLRIDGGYDRLTGEPFIGQLSRRIDARLPDQVQNTVITPMTTLLTSIEDESQNTLLASLGITVDDLNIDYLNSDGNSKIDSHLLNTALKIHKTVTVLSDKIDDNYRQMHEQPGMPNDASQAVYASLAERLSQTNSALDAALTDATSLIAILDQAEAKIRNNYDQRSIEPPADMGSSEQPGKHARTADVARQIPLVVNRLLNALDPAMDYGQVIGNARALETLVMKAINEENANDTHVDNAVSFFLNANNDSLIEALRIALSDDQADINTLVNNDFDGSDFSNEADISRAARISNNANAFSNLTGKKLKISDLDLGYAPNNLNDTELELYFSGTSSSLSGSIIACAKYIEGASKGQLGEGNFRGEIISGFWSLLGATQDNPSSYSLLLTFDFLGANYQAIMKPAGNTRISGVDYQQIRFDYNGEIKVWHSQQGFSEQQTIALPTNSKDCESRLPSRVGL